MGMCWLHETIELFIVQWSLLLARRALPVLYTPTVFKVKWRKSRGAVRLPNNSQCKQDLCLFVLLLCSALGATWLYRNMLKNVQNVWNTEEWPRQSRSSVGPFLTLMRPSGQTQLQIKGNEHKHTHTSLVATQEAKSETRPRYKWSLLNTSLNKYKAKH